jgi:hypothetical protein
MRALSAGLALLAVSALAGCGGVSASVRDLRSDAGTVCRQINHTFRGLSGPTTEAQAAKFLSGGAVRLAAQLQRLRQDNPPRDVADVFHAGLGALDQEVVVLGGAVRAINQGEDPALAYRLLKQRLAPLESQANDAWQALQIADCLQ